jgi:F0F1-type ATP synthase membrane subunit c/vacuolar-type H+-ATPase subunit K
LSLKLGIGIGVAIGLVVLGSVAAIGYAINRKVEADQRAELSRLQNLDYQEAEQQDDDDDE